MKILGKVGFTPKGEYNPDSIYEQYDVVNASGDSYTSLVNNNNYNIEDETKWFKMVDKGDKGEQGEQGSTPYIGNNGNWWIGDEDTGVSAEPEELAPESDDDIFSI